MNGNTAARPRGLVIGVVTAALAVTLAACSTSSSTGGTGSTGTTAPPSAPSSTSTSTTSTTKAASAPKASGALSGKWSGHYSGAYNGTFALTWRQSGTHLHGTIRISNPGSTLPINGTVNGSAITFGTVGSTAITYTGTVSGSSMSGTYKVQSASGSTGGPWSASKS